MGVPCVFDLSSITVAASCSLDLPQISTSTYDNSCSCMAIKLWDTIPCPIRLNPSIDAFKAVFFKYLLEKTSDVSDV